MTNRDWIAENRRDLIGEDLAVTNGTLVRCRDIGCDKCDLFNNHNYNSCSEALKEWLDKEYDEYIILTKEQLKKLPINTKVETKTSLDEWVRRYYDHYDEEFDMGLCFIDGCTSWSSDGKNYPWSKIRIRKDYYETKKDVM